MLVEFFQSGLNKEWLCVMCRGRCVAAYFCLFLLPGWTDLCGWAAALPHAVRPLRLVQTLETSLFSSPICSISRKYWMFQVLQPCSYTQLKAELRFGFALTSLTFLHSIKTQHLYLNRTSNLSVDLMSLAVKNLDFLWLFSDCSLQHGGVQTDDQHAGRILPISQSQSSNWATGGARQEVNTLPG